MLGPKDDMKLPPDIKAKLKNADSDVQKLVSYLIAENKKLQKKIVKYEFKNLTDKNRIDTLKEKLNEESKKEYLTVYLQDFSSKKIIKKMKPKP